MTGLFEVLASDIEHKKIAQNRTILAVQTRAKDRFGRFLAFARGEEWDARMAAIDRDLMQMLKDTGEEYGYLNGSLLYTAAAEVLSAGHPSGCDCGFCKNKGKLPGTSDEEDEGEEKESSVKQSFDYPSTSGPIEGEQADPSGPGGPIGEELSEESSGDNDEELGGPIGENASNKKGASVKVSAMQKRADGFAFCDCDCDGCNSGTHCESNNCIQSKRSGPRGFEPNSSYDWDRVAAEVETGDTFSQESVDLPAADESGLGSEGSPKIDKGKVPGDMAGNEGGLKPIDVPSKQHPSEMQDLGKDTPDYWSDLPGPSETGKSIDADSPLQPEFNVAPNTDTWSGTDGQADPVTSAVLSKWVVIK